MAKSTGKSVLFLCTGNYYRSRFAEIFFNSVAIRMGLPWQATSRALALERGAGNIGPIAVSVIQTLDRKGIQAADAVKRLPRSATPDDFSQATRVVALKQVEHQPLLQERFPEWVERVEYWHVDDAPEALDLIEREVMDLVARLFGGGERQERPPAAVIAPAPPPAVPRAKNAMTLKVGRETSGRRGKGVTTIFDTPLSDSELRELAALLKQRCGTGGTVKDGRIEIQGDQRERIVTELEKLGYKIKRVGG